MLSAEGTKPESNNRWKSDLGHVGRRFVGGYVWERGAICYTFEFLTYSKTIQSIFQNFCHNIAPNELGIFRSLAKSNGRNLTEQLRTIISGNSES